MNGLKSLLVIALMLRINSIMEAIPIATDRFTEDGSNNNESWILRVLFQAAAKETRMANNRIACVFRSTISSIPVEEKVNILSI